MHRLHKRLIFCVFITMAFGTLLLVNYIKQEHSTDLSKLSINRVKIGSEINIDEYVEQERSHFKKVSSLFKKRTS